MRTQWAFFGSTVLLGLSAVGNTAWVAAALGFRRAGAGTADTLLVVASSLFVLHDGGGVIGLACFAAAAVRLTRPRRGR